MSKIHARYQYEKDFYAWANYNAKLLREGRFSDLDVDNLIEELECMGRSERRELISRLKILLAHLLKWQFQPEYRSKSWLYTIKEQRLQVSELLADSPSLGRKLEQCLDSAYEKAVLQAAKETGMDEQSFPAKCPYSFEEAINLDFLP
ncbi:MAG: DUF29 domain-containing protein [Xenococcaceae cyanobacterium]